MWFLLPHLKQKPSLMRRSHLKDPSKAYSKIPVSISIASKSLWVLGG